MIRNAILISLLALSGCATTADLAQKAPARTATSSHPPQEVSRCLQLQLGVAPLTLPDGRASFVIDNGQGIPLGLVTIAPEGTGTRLELRKQGALAFGFHRWDPCL